MDNDLSQAILFCNVKGPLVDNSIQNEWVTILGFIKTNKLTSEEVLRIFRSITKKTSPMTIVSSSKELKWALLG